MEQTTWHHEEAFNDATAAFLRGFDHATLAPDAGEPEDPVAVRALIADRLRRGRMAGRPSHLRLLHGRNASRRCTYRDVLSALALGGPHRPVHPGTVERLCWYHADIDGTWPASVPKSGYVAVLFLTLVEFISLRGASAGCRAGGFGLARRACPVGAQFWTEHQIGHRLCVWIDEALKDEPVVFEASATRVKTTLGNVSMSWFAQGSHRRELWKHWIAEDGRLRKAG